jgi:hypothetical protein
MYRGLEVVFLSRAQYTSGASHFATETVTPAWYRVLTQSLSRES